MDESRSKRSNLSGKVSSYSNSYYKNSKSSNKVVCSEEEQLYEILVKHMEKTTKKAISKEEIERIYQEMLQEKIKLVSQQLPAGFDYIFKVVSQKIAKEGRRNLIDIDPSKKGAGEP